MKKQKSGPRRSGMKTKTTSSRPPKGKEDVKPNSASGPVPAQEAPKREARKSSEDYAKARPTKKDQKLEVLYEDNHIIAVNKRPGDIVQGDKTGDDTLIDLVKAYVKKKYDKPGDVYLGVIHRIDRPTSGVVIYARTSKALARMNELFRDNEVAKVYWAVVKHRPELETADLVHHLRKNEKQNKSYPCKEGSKGGKRAELSYRLCGLTDNYWMLEVHPQTGRHHQIRAQLSAIGSPIKGDLKYGADRSNRDGSIHLHARSVEFMHPVKKEKVRIVAPQPRESLWGEFAVQMK